MTRHTSMALRAAVLPALAMLGGCISLGPKVPDRLIDLTPNVPVEAGRTVTGRIGEGIVVLDPDTDRRLDVNRVPVQIDASNVAYLKDAMWVERPARQFRHLVAETLRAKSGSFVREGGEVDAVASRTLSGRLLEMGYDARTSSVVVGFDAMLNDQKGAIRARRFEARVPGVEAKAGPVGAALNQAANQVAGEVADWLAGG